MTIPNTPSVERTKHMIEQRHFFIRDMVEDHRIVVPYVYVTTTANLADFFTKPLAAAPVSTAIAMPS